MSPSFFFLIFAFVFFVFSAVILIVFRKNKTALYISLLLPQLTLCAYTSHLFFDRYYVAYSIAPVRLLLPVCMSMIIPIVCFVKYRAAKKAAAAQPPADDAE